MDAVTYPDQRVARFIAENLIPVRVSYDHEQLSKQFNVKWTPTLITLDSDGQEHHRTVGFLSPEDFIASQLLGIGKTHFENGAFDKAISTFDELTGSYPRSSYAAEAIYLLGVARYKSTHDPKPLRGAYERLSHDYPDSEWAKRAYPYRLIQ